MGNKNITLLRKGGQLFENKCKSRVPFGMIIPILVLCVCAVNGAWGQWSRWSSCSVSPLDPSVYVRVRTRRCDSPPPSEGGLPCVGTAMEVDMDGCSRNEL